MLYTNTINKKTNISIVNYKEHDWLKTHEKKTQEKLNTVKL